MELPRRLAAFGVFPVGGDFIQWLDDEAAIPVSGVRDVEVSFLDDSLAVENEVEIERARAPVDDAFASELVLDRLQQAQQSRGTECRFDFDGGVEEIIAGLFADRSGAVEGTGGDDLSVRFRVDEADRRLECVTDIAEVAAEGDEGVN